ncbi:MAG: 1,6-anhydro-N-acetylmuramyl-L-alanine amidase AmpD [Thauera sp.]|nr:1,6-anhydro-N-acetylmuramyl-L-alanine amidase AmpD [Thauera sp.]
MSLVQRPGVPEQLAPDLARDSSLRDPRRGEADVLLAGWLSNARAVPSPNSDARPGGETPTLVVVHAISLPPEQFGGPGVEQLFTNALDPQEHPYYATICHLRVSAHFFIRRDGELIQFVSADERAWHAGVSSWEGRERCNDFSIGIELEGCDTLPFEPVQYERLEELLGILRANYPIRGVVGHSDIAPGRKTDPGPCFDWARLEGGGLVARR